MASSIAELSLLENDEDLFAMSYLFSGAESYSYRTYCQGGGRLDLTTMSEDQVKVNFRFEKADIPRLAAALRIPNTVTLNDRSVCSDTKSLCVLLRRLSYPNRLSDLEREFGRPKSVLSAVINETVDDLYTRFSHLLNNLDQPWLDLDHVTMYAQAVEEKGAPYSHCFGFIDGIVRPVSRPKYLQKMCYNGHKRVHSIKFQSVVTPNGLIANLYGPLEGKRHDCGLLRESGLLGKLEGIPRDREGNVFYLYGDPAYPMRPQLQAPLKGARLTREQAEFNKNMSSVRECVEWMFGKLVSNFQFLDYKKNLKLFLQPVAKYYMIDALLTNCHTCLYGSITSSYFGLDPPSLEEYLVLQ